MELAELENVNALFLLYDVMNSDNLLRMRMCSRDVGGAVLLGYVMFVLQPESCLR